LSFSFIGLDVKNQNILLLLASYLFYAWWDWRFLGLIIFSSIIDYSIGRKLGNVNTKLNRRLLLWLSLGINLGLLGFFKYFNFFIDSFTDAFSLFGYAIHGSHLDIILPVGISFYTFQTLSYTIDVYRKDIEPTKDLVSFFTFVSFFPQLVAGPIERATNLLPQFYNKRSFTYENGRDGLRQILWGLFKKIVIADNCAQIVNEIFANYEQMSSISLGLGAVLFAFQIYGDFSGYSDIAIGTSKLFGFHLKRNFAFPYFSRDIAEFWRRWHISLSTWFRDYVYIPLGGSQQGKWINIRNIFIIFLVSGAWHGANWTFVIWGFLNALYFLPLFLLNRNRKHMDHKEERRWFPRPYLILQILFTFTLTCIAWVFFRADNVTEAFNYLNRTFINTQPGGPLHINGKFLLALIVFILIEWNHRNKAYGLDFNNTKTPKIIRHLSYYGIIICIFTIGGEQSDFIYFQF
jgi:D-alanyl-lipoteichoic acid acyltransferase DltB (MBOAT superfamily)